MGIDGWIVRLEPVGGEGPRVAVKDAIDVVGQRTLVGSPWPSPPPTQGQRRRMPSVSRLCARPGSDHRQDRADRAVLVRQRAERPRAAADPTHRRDRIPGGSPAVRRHRRARRAESPWVPTRRLGASRPRAAGRGLTTTWGRIPLDGVWPLAPSLDTVGPLARDVAGLELGMRLLDPTYEPVAITRPSVVRLHTTTVDPLRGRGDRRSPSDDGVVRSSPAWRRGGATPAGSPSGPDRRRCAPTASTLLDHETLLSDQVEEHRGGARGSRIEDGTGRQEMSIFRQRMLNDGRRRRHRLPTLAFLPPRIEDPAGTTLLTSAA